MVAWSRRAARRPSCRKRATASRSAAKLGGRTFTATWRSTESCVARKTSPMPPLPRRRSRRKPPRVVPQLTRDSGTATMPWHCGQCACRPLTLASASIRAPQVGHSKTNSIGGLSQSNRTCREGHGTDTLNPRGMQGLGQEGRGLAQRRYFERPGRGKGSTPASRADRNTRGRRGPSSAAAAVTVSLPDRHHADPVAARQRCLGQTHRRGRGRRAPPHECP